MARVRNRDRRRRQMLLLPEFRRFRVGGIDMLIRGSLHRPWNAAATPLGVGNTGKAEAARRDYGQKRVFHKRGPFAVD
jgi:hypothetical protein